MFWWISRFSMAQIRWQFQVDTVQGRNSVVLCSSWVAWTFNDNSFMRWNNLCKWRPWCDPILVDLGTNCTPPDRMFGTPHNQWLQRTTKDFRTSAAIHYPLFIPLVNSFYFRPQLVKYKKKHSKLKYHFENNYDGGGGFWGGGDGVLRTWLSHHVGALGSGALWYWSPSGRLGLL